MVERDTYQRTQTESSHHKHAMYAIMPGTQTALPKNIYGQATMWVILAACADQSHAGHVTDRYVEVFDRVEATPTLDAVDPKTAATLVVDVVIIAAGDRHANFAVTCMKSVLAHSTAVSAW